MRSSLVRFSCFLYQVSGWTADSSEHLLPMFPFFRVRWTCRRCRKCAVLSSFSQDSSSDSTFFSCKQVERMPGQLFSGTLGLLRPSSAATKEKQEAERRDREGPGADSKPRTNDRPKIVWFKPTDKRVPLIAISTEQAPADFLDNSEAYANVLFCACIKRWPIT